MVLQHNKEVDDIDSDPAYDQYKLSTRFIPTDCVKSIFKANIQMKPHILFLPLMRQLKSWFTHVIHPILSEESSTNILFSFSKGVGGHWCDQVFCINNYAFGYLYDMETASLVLVDNSTCLDKNAHGGYSDFEVSFETVPSIIHFIHYTLW